MNKVTIAVLKLVIGIIAYFLAWSTGVGWTALAVMVITGLAVGRSFGYLCDTNISPTCRTITSSQDGIR